MCLLHGCQGWGAGTVGEAVGCVAYGVEYVLEAVVFYGEGERGSRGPVDAQGVEDDGGVDALLEQSRAGRAHAGQDMSMPPRALCTAMCRARWAMGTASVRQSTRVGGQDDVGGARCVVQQRT
ncbi:hypothetical protein AV521_31935 [Streptomyces sp. IMTB 2501]|nr:hypothetical protein AV521_31935 [Streptomyces sp. IMTB 2501]